MKGLLTRSSGHIFILLTSIIVATCSACSSSEGELNATVTRAGESLPAAQSSDTPPPTPLPTGTLTSELTLTPTNEPIASPSPDPTDTLTNEATLTPTSKPIASSSPELTETITSESTLTPTSELIVSPSPEPNATSSGLLTATCRDSMKGLRALTHGLGFPEHLSEMMPEKTEDDFDVDSYFSVLEHLSLEEGYTLDYVYYADELGGKPLVYARMVDRPPFTTYLEFIESKGGASYRERSYGGLEFAFEYLDFVHVDDVEDGYLQLALMATVGDQFYLYWHALYHDEVILCDQADIEKAIAEVQGFNLELTNEIVTKARKLDFEPTVTLDDETATVRFVIFTKWGGFIEVQYIFTREYPHRFVGGDYQTLIKYDCGILF